MANNLGDLQDSGTLVQNTTATVNGAITTASTSVVIAAANPYLFVGQTVTGFGIPNANGITGATKITTISADGKTLTLSTPVILADKTVLTFSSIYAPVCTTTVNGAISSATQSVTIVANAAIAAGQIVSGVGINAATATVPNTVNNIGTTTSLVLNASTSAAVADKAVLVFWAPANQNVSVDFVWKNIPLQANDDRATVSAANFAATGTRAVADLKITDATSDGVVSTFTTNNDHGLVVGSVINTGSYALGGTVANPTAGTTVGATTATPNTGASSVTANTDNNTITINFGTNHGILPGQTVTITGTIATSATNYTTLYQGTYIAQSGTATTALVLNGGAPITAARAAGVLSTTGTSVAMPNITTAGTVTVYNYDLNQAVVASVPTTKTFTVVNPFGYANSTAVTFSSKSATIEILGDSSWNYNNGAVLSGNVSTTKKQSDRLTFTKTTDTQSPTVDRFTISNTINGNAYETPIYDGLIVDAGFYGYPNFNTGKYLASSVTVGGKTGNSYILVTCPNNFSDLPGTTKVTVTGLSNSSLTTALTGATVTASTPDYFIVAGTDALLGTTVSATALVQVVNWGVANYTVTAAAVDATTNTKYIYTAQNNLQPGDSVNITGLSDSRFNTSSAQSVASATATSFTLTSQTALTGVAPITGQTGKVEYANALSNVDGAYSSGAPGYLVPNVLGKYDAAATDALKDRGFVPTAGSTTSSSSNAVNASAVARTAGTTLAVLTNSAGTDFTNIVVGDVLTVSSSSLAGLVNNVDYPVVAKIDAKNIVVNSGASTVLSSGTLTVTPRIGTVHTQQYAAGTRQTSTAITTGLWAS